MSLLTCSLKSMKCHMLLSTTTEPTRTQSLSPTSKWPTRKRSSPLCKPHWKKSSKHTSVRRSRLATPKSTWPQISQTASRYKCAVTEPTMRTSAPSRPTSRTCENLRSSTIKIVIMRLATRSRPRLNVSTSLSTRPGLITALSPTDSRQTMPNTCEYHSSYLNSWIINTFWN